MSGRHQPENGADSADALAGAGFIDSQDIACPRCDATYTASETHTCACTMCNGSGEVMGGDEYQRCPQCLADIEHGGGHGVGGELRTMVTPSDLSLDVSVVHETPAASRTPGVDMRSSALLVFITYIETKRRLRPGKPDVDAGFFDGLDMVRNYVRELVQSKGGAPP